MHIRCASVKGKCKVQPYHLCDFVHPRLIFLPAKTRKPVSCRHPVCSVKCPLLYWQLYIAFLRISDIGYRWVWLRTKFLPKNSILFLKYVRLFFTSARCICKRRGWYCNTKETLQIAQVIKTKNDIALWEKALLIFDLGGCTLTSRALVTFDFGELGECFFNENKHAPRNPQVSTTELGQRCWLF